MSTTNKWLPQDHVSKALKEVFIENAAREMTPTRQNALCFS